MTRNLLNCFFILSLCVSVAAKEINYQSISIPKIGDYSLRVLSPELIELRIISSNILEKTSDFTIIANGEFVGFDNVGFKRRPIYAPLARYDLRIENCFYINCQTIPNDSVVDVYKGVEKFTTQIHSNRDSPVIHINQEGYALNLQKKAFIGYYLGDLGEMVLPFNSFSLVDADTYSEVYVGQLVERRDYGYNYLPTPYQNVLEADFSAFQTSGKYRILVSGLGVSLPFLINDGVTISFTRAYALGIYHQRCGESNGLPFTRFYHGICHDDLVQIPNSYTNFVFTWNTISNYSGITNFNNPFQIAPRLISPETQLFPFINTGEIDVSGGHHDAGDYSKYTINSANFIHLLMFSVDYINGVKFLDNLGIPESGDGISDVLQEAKKEADFISKMQDLDGGFYFLVYPKNREYESGSLPENGDLQVVWPKNTSATAAAVAALAQCSSSLNFKRQYPEDAERYLAQAKLGWKFLTNAIFQYGKDGIYQKITHYGDNYTDKDELAWAACEMFLATGDTNYQSKLLEWFPDPTEPTTFRWGWWKMSEGWGNAIRSYAFSTITNKIQSYLTQCIQTITNAGNDARLWSEQNAYQTSFPLETKRYRSAGWYFSCSQAFDILAAQELFPNDKYVNALVGNMNYELGCNPVNVSYLTGLGHKRQFEIVDQYSQNDKRTMPKIGVPIGNIQNGFVWVNTYGTLLSDICYPPDEITPFYDRWGDAFNTTTEFVILDQARGLMVGSYLSALVDKTNALFKTNVIINTPTFSKMGSTNILSLKDIFINAKIIWEGRDNEPFVGAFYNFIPKNNGSQWVEVEIQYPDGSRFFGETNFVSDSDNIVWVEDSVPKGASVGSFIDNWNWLTNSYSGLAAHDSVNYSGLHEHWFWGAEDLLSINTNDILYTYVYLNSVNPPREIMLSWNNGTWEHRAYWGENLITYGQNDSSARRYMGQLPDLGKWIKLVVPASFVGLEGSILNGMSFSSYGGSLIWDCSGKESILAAPTGLNIKLK